MKISISCILFGTMLQNEYYGFKVSHFVGEIPTDMPNSPNLTYNVECVSHRMEVFY